MIVTGSIRHRSIHGGTETVELVLPEEIFDQQKPVGLKSIDLSLIQTRLFDCGIHKRVSIEFHCRQAMPDIFSR